MARRHARSVLLLLAGVILLATIDNVACGQSSAEQSIKCADVNVEVVPLLGRVVNDDHLVRLGESNEVVIALTTDPDGLVDGEGEDGADQTSPGTPMCLSRSGDDGITWNRQYLPLNSDGSERLVPGSALFVSSFNHDWLAVTATTMSSRSTSSPSAASSPSSSRGMAADGAATDEENSDISESMNILLMSSGGGAYSSWRRYLFPANSNIVSVLPHPNDVCAFMVSLTRVRSADQDSTGEQKLRAGDDALLFLYATTDCGATFEWVSDDALAVFWGDAPQTNHDDISELDFFFISFTRQLDDGSSQYDLKRPSSRQPPAWKARENDDELDEVDRDEEGVTVDENGYLTVFDDVREAGFQNGVVWIERIDISSWSDRVFERRLHLSADDGATFHRAIFPFEKTGSSFAYDKDHETVDGLLTRLDRAFEIIFLSPEFAMIAVSQQYSIYNNATRQCASYPSKNLFASGALLHEFDLSLTNLYVPSDYEIDHGLAQPSVYVDPVVETVYLANICKDLRTSFDSPCVYQTVVTHRRGAAWFFMPPPMFDTSCEGSTSYSRRTCTLNLVLTRPSSFVRRHDAALGLVASQGDHDLRQRAMYHDDHEVHRSHRPRSPNDIRVVHKTGYVASRYQTPGLLFFTGMVGGGLQAQSQRPVKLAQLRSSNAGVTWTAYNGDISTMTFDDGYKANIVFGIATSGNGSSADTGDDDGDRDGDVQTFPYSFSHSQGSVWSMCSFETSSFTSYSSGEEGGDDSLRKGTSNIVNFGPSIMSSHKTTVLVVATREGARHTSIVRFSFDNIEVPTCRGKATPGNLQYSDYEVYYPRTTYGAATNCFMGAQDGFVRRIYGSICQDFAQSESLRLVNGKVCPCALDDYECDMGFIAKLVVAQWKWECIRDPLTYNASRSNIPDDCAGYFAITRGYRIIPGDVCDTSLGLNLLPVIFPCPTDADKAHAGGGTTGSGHHDASDSPVSDADAGWGGHKYPSWVNYGSKSWTGSSFTLGGTPNSGGVDLEAIRQALFPYGPYIVVGVFLASLTVTSIMMVVFFRMYTNSDGFRAHVQAILPRSTIQRIDRAAMHALHQLVENNSRDVLTDGQEMEVL